ncbi:hypothetical protein O5282_20900, partial [Escherichia coli]|nr:hypothetical protein [Escherichia coli]
LGVSSVDSRLIKKEGFLVHQVRMKKVVQTSLIADEARERRLSSHHGFNSTGRRLDAIYYRSRNINLSCSTIKTDKKPLSAEINYALHRSEVRIGKASDGPERICYLLHVAALGRVRYFEFEYDKKALADPSL